MVVVMLEEGMRAGSGRMSMQWGLLSGRHAEAIQPEAGIAGGAIVNPRDRDKKIEQIWIAESAATTTDLRLRDIAAIDREQSPPNTVAENLLPSRAARKYLRTRQSGSLKVRQRVNSLEEIEARTNE